MRKLSKLASALKVLNLGTESSLVLKLGGMDTLGKYSYILSELQILLSGPPDNTYVGYSGVDLLTNANYQQWLIPGETLLGLIDRVGLKISEVGKEKVKLGLSVWVNQPLSKEEEERIREENAPQGGGKLPPAIGNGILWREKGAFFAYQNSQLYVVMNPEPEVFFGGNPSAYNLQSDNWIFSANLGLVGVLSHEITHALDSIRWKTETINQNDLDPNRAAYVKSGREIHARIMDLESMIMTHCGDKVPGGGMRFLTRYVIEGPSYGAEYNPDSICHNLIFSIYDGDFLRFKDLIFNNDYFANDILILENVKSENVLKIYNKKLYELFLKLRRDAGLGELGTGSLRSIK